MVYVTKQPVNKFLVPLPGIEVEFKDQYFNQKGIF